jgi:hypothetical protein
MTTLNYDANGFIVGINRMKDGIDNVHDDTQEIIQILKSQNQIGNTRMRELTRAVKSANYRSESQASASASRTRSGSLDRRPRISSSASTDSINSRSSDRTSNRTSNQSRVSRNSSGAADRNTNSSGSSDSRTRSSDGSSSNAHRERDANGRFISDGSNTRRGFGLPGGSMDGFGHSDVSGMDPVLDSLREAKDLLSPIGRAGKLAGRAGKFSWSKFKSMKRREPLSNDETRHNRENEKLLDKIWKAIKKQGGRGGNTGRGLLGGLLGGAAAGGGLLKKLGKMKFLGPLAALAGAGSLAMDWDTLDHQGKSEGVGGLAGAGAGGLAGMKLGAMAGAIGGPVGVAIGGAVGGIAGAWLGSDGGEALGAAASPYIEDWTKAITAYNLPKKMGDTWDDGIKPFFSRMDEIAGKMSKWIEDNMTDIVDAANNFADDTVDTTGGVAGLAMDAMGFGDDGLGSLSAKYEGKIGSANPDNIGWAYGKYQFNSATGGLNQFFKDNPEYAKQFSGLTPASDGFNKKWKSIAANDGEKFGKAQDKSAAKLWYAPAAASAKEKGFKMDDRGVQEAIFSGSIQHGGIKKIIKSASSQKGFADMTAEQQIQAFYKSRRAYARKNVKPSVMKGLDKRYDAELNDAVALSRVSKQKDKVKAAVKDTVTQKQPASKEADKSLAGKAKNNSSALGVSMGSMVPEKTKKANIANSSFSENKPMIFNSSTPAGSNTGYAPANMPASPVLKIPAAPKIKERLDSGGSNKPVVLQSSNDTINQNLSDRGLAHAVTGGFGQDRMWG